MHIQNRESEIRQSLTRVLGDLSHCKTFGLLQHSDGVQWGWDEGLTGNQLASVTSETVKLEDGHREFPLWLSG